MKTEIFAKISPYDIDFLTKIIEAYDNLGISSTINPSEGEIIIRVTEDTYHDMMDILHHMPFPVQILDSSELSI